MNRTLFSFSTLALAVCFTACSSGPAPAKKAVEKKAAEPVSGQSGVFQMFQVARTWAPDVQILKVTNGDLADVKAQPGKHGVWNATFVSLTKKQKRDFTYAVAEGDGMLKGVRPGSEMPFAKSNQTVPFAIQELKIDTIAATETADKQIAKDKSMAKVLEENKDLPVQYLLEWNKTDKKPTWRIIYGPSISQSKFSIIVDANSGEFIKKMH